MASLAMYRRRPSDTPPNMRIIARTLPYIHLSERADRLARIRWWQSWGFDPFEPVDMSDLADGEMTQEDWNAMVEQALRVGEPGYMMVPQGIIRAAGEVEFARQYLNEWPPYAAERGDWGSHPQHINAMQQYGVAQESDWGRATRVTFDQPVTVRDGESLVVRGNRAIAVQEYDPRTLRYRINGEWVDEIDLFNSVDDLPDM